MSLLTIRIIVIVGLLFLIRIFDLCVSFDASIFYYIAVEKLGNVVLERIKHMVGYEGSDLGSLEESGYNFLLKDFEHYGPGDFRTVQEFLNHTMIDMKAEKCGWIDWCNDCTLW